MVSQIEVPLVETRFSYCFLGSKHWPTDTQTKLWDMVYTFDEEDIESEHQDRHYYDMVNFLGCAYMFSYHLCDYDILSCFAVYVL
jgi:hypothetical protein